MSERSNERITDELLICDSEEAYVKRLAELLLLKKEVTVGVRTCSLPEHVEHLIEIGNVKVLLISEVVPYQERKRVFAGKRIVLTREHCENNCTDAFGKSIRYLKEKEWTEENDRGVLPSTSHW